MSLTFDVTVSDARLAALPAELRAKAGDAVWKTAKDIHREAAEESPFRYGHLRSSHQVHRISDLEALISVGAEYALHVHEGTVRMPGRPWLNRVAERHRPAFLAAIASLYS